MGKKKNGSAVERLLEQLRVGTVKWTADGRLLVDLVGGPRVWDQFRRFDDERLTEWAASISRIALDSGSGVLDCWWDAETVIGAGFAQAEALKTESWSFAFQVKSLPPNRREQTWIGRRVSFHNRVGRQLIIKGREISAS